MHTNNLFSNIYINGTSMVKPELGMGATECSYTDRHAGTIVDVFELRGVTYIGVQRDHAKRVDDYGMSDMQEYEYTPDPNARVTHYRFKNGKWQGTRKNPETGRWVKCDHGGLIVGARRKYYDFSF